MSMQDSLAPMRPLRVIGANKLIAILNTVRTRMLEWALSLEEEGILGNGLSFSASEKQAAMQSQNIRIENFQGVLGDVVGGSVTQTNAQHIAASDFSSLARHLLARGIHQADIGELEQAVRDDPEPASGKRFGPRVSAWMGKMVGKAASGSWDVTVATASGVLASALSKFYGFG
ncbi:AbiTii domain-containing protein [Luteibacter jiangsuensis]